jgi:hypothetical protein
MAGGRRSKTMPGRQCKRSGQPNRVEIFISFI